MIMGSTMSKTIGREQIDKQTEVTGGFHVLEVSSRNMGGKRKHFCGTEFPVNFNNLFNLYFPTQIHGQTATWGIATLVILTIPIYGIWRVCRRRMVKERNRNLAASFQLSQSQTSRIPIFGQVQQDLPPSSGDISERG